MTNTNLESTPWDNAESNFQSWLKGNDGGKPDILTEILKTNYLLTRNRLRGLLSKYCENSLAYLERKDEQSPTIYYSKEDQVSESHIEFCFKIPSVEEENEEIIEGLYTGNQRIFNNLYEYEFPKVVKLVTHNNGSVDNARDIFQDALVILIEKVYYNELHLSCSIGTYLYAISQNLWLSKLRRNKFFISLCKLSFNNSELEVRLIEDENTPENIDSITNAIENLGNPCKQLLELFYYKNESWDDIASTLGYSNGASARNQKYKCLERLRKQLVNALA